MTTPIEQKIGEIIKDSKKLFNSNSPTYEIDVKRMLEHFANFVRNETIQEMINLSDNIEMSYPDGGTQQWMAFKAFRNTMRESLKEQSK